MNRTGVLLLISFLVSGVATPGELPRTFATTYESTLDLLNREGAREVGPEMDLSLLQEVDPQKKSVGLAVLYSLLLPGMGELYADGFGSGKYFLMAEGALWLTFTTFELYGNQLRDDARAFAFSRAGVNPAGKDDQYYVDIGNFLDIYDYNEKQLRDRELDKLYDPAAGFAWEWDSDASRATYRDQRISSENMYNNKKFVVAAILVNHVASAVNAARAAISHNSALDKALGDLSLSAQVLGGPAHPHGVKLTLSRSL
jgi:hypothetical protein